MAGLPLQLRLLGEFALARDGQALAVPKSKKGRLLAAYLALRVGSHVRRENLGALLWPDVDADRALFNLRQCLASIRREAPDLSPHILAVDRATLTFEPADVLVDVQEFRRLAKTSAAKAIELYSGALLPEFDDDWLVPLRSELEGLYLTEVEALADAADPREAVALLRRALEADPYREPLQQKLFVRLAECGDLAGVKAAYRRFQELLHHELNASPSTETDRLFHRLVESVASAKEPAPIPTAPRHKLPVPATAILGRSQEVEDVCKLLETSRLVTLLGPGGAGKTRLAVAVGDRELPNRRDGVWFVDFSPVTDPTRVTQTVAQSVGIREQAGKPWADALAEALEADDRLLILDNCEHLLEACCQVADGLLLRCPAVRILATSRVPLSAPGEQRFQVPSLQVPPRGIQEHDYMQFSALELFQARARLVSPRFTVGPNNADLVISICREIDAMPLGIEMAAARLAALPLEEVARRLDDKLAFMRSPSRTTMPRQRTLGAVIEWSYELLSEDARTLLRRLSAFAGGWSLEAAEAVCGFGVLQAGQVLDTLVTLVEASLVRRDEERYYLLETVRQFAAELIAGEQEEADANDRLLGYFAELFADIEQLVGVEGPDRVGLRYGQDLANIRAALDWSLAGGRTEEGLRLIARASTLFSIVQLDGEAAAWLRRLLAVSGVDPASPARMSALARASFLFLSLYTDFERATARKETIEACEELARLARAKGDAEALAEALTNLGRARLWWDRDLAKQALEEALSVHLSLPNGGQAQRPLRLLGQWAYDVRELDEAESIFERAAAQAERVNDVREMMYVLVSCSHLHREVCRYDEALNELEQIQRILRRRPDARMEAFNQLRFAELYLDRWDFDAMRSPLELAQRFFVGNRSRLHGMLIDGLVRYQAAHEGRLADAAAGLPEVAGRLISDARENPSAFWHGACIEFEALSYCLALAGKQRDGARMFGVAQSLRGRDWAFLSPSVKARWAHLSDAAGFEAFEGAVAEGRDLTPEQALAEAEALQASLLEAANTPSAASVIH